MSESEDTFMAMAGALARLLRSMDEEEGLPDENHGIYPDSTCKCVSLGSSPNQRQCSDNAQFPQFKYRYQSNICTTKNFNCSPRPWHGNTVSATTRDIEYTSPLSPNAPRCANDKQPIPRVSNERRLSFNRIARPFNLEKHQARVHSPVAVPLSTSNNCSSVTIPIPAHYDVVVSGSRGSEDILQDNQWTTITVEGNRPLDMHEDFKEDDDLTDIEIRKSPVVKQMKINSYSEERTEKDLASEVNKTTQSETKPFEKLFVNTSVKEFYDTDFDFLEPACPYSLSPQELGDITLTPSMLTRAKNGVYHDGAQRYVTLARSNAQLDGGVCSVGTTFKADQLHDLYKSTSGVYGDEQQIDKHMLGLQIEHLATYTSNHKPNDLTGVDLDEQPHFVEYEGHFTKEKYSKLPSHASCSQESLLSWQDCRSTLDSDDDNDQIESNVYMTALSHPSYSSSFDEDTLREPIKAETQKEPDVNVLWHNGPVCPSYDKTIYEEEELILDDNQRQNHLIADPYLNISRQWSWYPYKENETPGKSTSPRRKKIILTPCSKHSSKKSKVPFQSEPFQYGDCEECSEYIRNIKLIVETSKQSDLSSKAFLRKLMEPAFGITTGSPSDVSLYRLVENKVAEDISTFSDFKVSVDDASFPNVDMAGDDSKCKDHATDDMKAIEEKRWYSEYVSEDQTPKEIKTLGKAPKCRSYRKIAKTIVWNVLLNAIAKIVVNKVIYKTFQSIKTKTNEIKHYMISESPIVIDHKNVNYLPEDESHDLTEPSENESEKFASTTSLVSTEGVLIEIQESVIVVPSYHKEEQRKPISIAGKETVLDTKSDSKLQIQTSTLVSQTCEQTIKKYKGENVQTTETQPSDDKSEEFASTTRPSLVSSEAELIKAQKCCSIALSYQKEKQQEHSLTDTVLNTKSDSMYHIPAFLPIAKQMLSSSQPNDNKFEKVGLSTSCVSLEDEEEELMKTQMSCSVLPSYKKKEQKTSKLTCGEEMVLNTKSESALKFKTSTLGLPNADQSLPSTEAGDTSGLSLSDITFKNLNYVKDKLLAARHTMTNIVKTYRPNGGSPAVYPDEKNYDDFGRLINHRACDFTSETVDNKITRNEIGSSVTTTGLHQIRIHSREHDGQNTKRWGDTIPTTCDCCNKYICTLNENLKHTDVKETKSITLDKEESTRCGFVIQKTGDDQIRNATTTPDDYCGETVDHPALFSSSELNDQTVDVQLSKKVVNMDTSSSKSYGREEPSIDFVEFDEVHVAPPAGIDTKIYVWEKFKDFRPIPKQDVVIESPETPTRERIEYFEGLMTRNDTVADVVGKDNTGETNLPENREVILDVSQRTNEVNKKIEDKIESPGSFTIFQAFFDALHSPLPSDDESLDKTDTTLHDKSAASYGHTFQKDVNDYEERETATSAEIYEDIAMKPCLNRPTDVTNSNCDMYLWNSSICEVKEDEELMKDIARKTSDVSFHSAYEDISSTSECKPNDDSKKLNKNKQKKGYGFFRRLFTKKHKTKTSKKSKEEKVERYQDENSDQHRDGPISDIEWDEDVVAVDSIVRTDGESGGASLEADHQESCVEDIANSEKNKDIKKKRKPSFLVKFGRSLTKKGELTDGAVSKTGHQKSGNSDPNKEATTSKHLYGTFGKNKSSPKKRLFSFKDVKRSKEKAVSKSSRHPLK